jgi:hypothetical protein
MILSVIERVPTMSNTAYSYLLAPYMVVRIINMNHLTRETSALSRFARKSINSHIFGNPPNPPSSAPTSAPLLEIQAPRKTSPRAANADTPESSVLSSKHTAESCEDGKMSGEQIARDISNPASGPGEPQHTEYFSCTIHGEQIETKILSKIQSLMSARLEAERANLVDDTARRLLPQLQAVAAEAAGKEMDSFIEELKRETEDEKVQAITNRLQDLDTDFVQRVFLQRSVVEVLRRLLNRLEADLAIAEWEAV